MGLTKQTRKQRKDTVFGAVSGLVFLCGFSIWWQFHLSFYFLIAVIFMSVALGAKAASYVPDMRKKENKNKNPYTGLPQKKSMKKTDKLPSSRQRTGETTPSSSNNRTRKYNIRSDEIILQLPLEDLSGFEFEQLVFLYFKAIGYKPVKTPETKDGGVDMILTNKSDGIKIAVQVKHRYKSKNQITVKEIRELDSAKKNHRCVSTWFITSGTFTNDALRQADVYRMKTSDVTYVERKIIPWKEREAARRKSAARHTVET